MIEMFLGIKFNLQSQVVILDSECHGNLEHNVQIWKGSWNMVDFLALTSKGRSRSRSRLNNSPKQSHDFFILFNRNLKDWMSSFLLCKFTTNVSYSCCTGEQEKECTWLDSWLEVGSCKAIDSTLDNDSELLVFDKFKAKVGHFKLTV